MYSLYTTFRCKKYSNHSQLRVKTLSEVSAQVSLSLVVSDSQTEGHHLTTACTTCCSTTSFSQADWLDWARVVPSHRPQAVPADTGKQPPDHSPPLSSPLHYAPEIFIVSIRWKGQSNWESLFKYNC